MFVAGQIGWDAPGAFAPRPRGQVRQALLNIVAVLAEAGARPEHVVRMTWYVTDRDDYLAHAARDRRRLPRGDGPPLPGDGGRRGRRADGGRATGRDRGHRGGARGTLSRLRAWSTPSSSSTSPAGRSRRWASEQLAAIPEVTAVFSVAGRVDLVANVRVQNNEDLADVVAKRFLDVQGVDASRNAHRLPRLLARGPGGRLLDVEVVSTGALVS